MSARWHARAEFDSGGKEGTVSSRENGSSLVREMIVEALVVEVAVVLLVVGQQVLLSGSGGGGGNARHVDEALAQRRVGVEGVKINFWPAFSVEDIVLYS